MVIVQMYAETPSSPLLDTAWAILETANDLQDIATVETCRRIIDATLRGDIPAQSDVELIFDYFK